ncbi:MAG: helix-turn-helix transcriptional regulator [Cyanobacteria bacterium J06639_1]
MASDRLSSPTPARAVRNESSPVQTFAQRLTLALGSESVHAFSRRAGISNTALRSYLKGSIPGIDKAMRIAATAEVNLLWLIAGEGEPYPDESRLDEPNGELTYIPLIDVSVSAGLGVLAREATIEHAIAFNAQWLRGKIDCNPENLSIVTVHGDSMYPTLQDGDLILVDSQVSEPRDDIYVFQMEGELLVKRLQRLPGGLLSVISDNPRFPPFTVNPSDPSLNVSVVGRYRGHLSFA